MIRRLKALCLAPSHTTYYKKLDEYGKQHDAEINDKVSKESERLQNLHPISSPHSLEPNSIVHVDVGRKIVLDNIDYHQSTHNMTESYKDPDLHFCSYMSTENRVSGNHLSDQQPIADIMDMANGKVLPSQLDHSKQRNDYVVLVSRHMTEEIDCLKFLKGVTTSHIRHQYSDELKQKTKTVRSMLFAL